MDTTLIIGLSGLAGIIFKTIFDYWKIKPKQEIETVYIEVQALRAALDGLQTENKRLMDRVESLHDDNKKLRDLLNNLSEKMNKTASEPEVKAKQFKQSVESNDVEKANACGIKP